MNEEAIELLKKARHNLANPPSFEKCDCETCCGIDKAIALLSKPQEKTFRSAREMLKEYLPKDTAKLDGEPEEDVLRYNKERAKPAESEFVRRARKIASHEIYKPRNAMEKTILEACDRLEAETREKEAARDLWIQLHKACKKHALKADELQKANEDLKAENARLEDIIDKIQNWCKAYPISVFPKPDLKKAHKVLKKAGMTLDAISADNMRYVLEGIQEIINKQGREANDTDK